LVLSTTEENYLKAIFKLSLKGPENISTNNIAAETQTTAASVSDMLKRLSEKQLVAYEKYKGVQLTETGRNIAIELIRSHRLWEVFLVDKLGYKWDEVHVIAEELEHIKTPDLISRLEAFLGYPTNDPHGDPIPDAEGNIHNHEPISLNELNAAEKGIVVRVGEQSVEFLQYLDRIKLHIGSRVDVLEVNSYDNSRLIRINSTESVFLSEKVSENLIVKRV
jgi:DtxR family transcriptional regulator, Mn-dependent transcriptional regulator